MPLSGKAILALFVRAGWTILRQKGSHVILVKENIGGKKSTVVPLRKEVAKGALLDNQD